MRKPFSCLRILFQFLLLIAFVFSANAQSCKLIEAIKSKDSLLIERLIADPTTDIKCTDTNNATALMWAVINYNNSGNHFAKMLIKNGVDPKLKGIIYEDSLKQSYVGSPLAAAAKNGNLAMVQFLIDSCGIDVDEREFSTQGNAWTALFYAVQSFHVGITDYLLSKKCNVNVKDQYGFTPLMYLCTNGFIELAEKLIKAGANINDTVTLNGITWTPLLLAASYKNAGVMYRLIKNNADTTVCLKSGDNAITLARTPTANYGVSIYHGCARDNCPELAEMLYKKGDKLNEEAVFAGAVKYTPLRLAFYNQSLKYAEWLLQHGVDTTGNLIEIKDAIKKNSLNNNNMLIQAIDSNYTRVAEILVRNLNFDFLIGEKLIRIFESKHLKNIYLKTYNNEADTKNTYNTLTWVKKAKPFLNDVLSNCTQLNFIIEESYNRSITPLIYSILNFQNDMFDKLIANGADINYSNRYGETPLMFSVLCNNTYAFNKLHKIKGLELNLADKLNQTALSLAVLGHDEEKVKVLIQTGIELNSQDMDGNTPLLLALISGQKNIVRLLLKAGSDKFLQNNNHETLYSLLNIPKESPDNVITNSLNNDLQYALPINISVQTGFEYLSFFKKSNDGTMFMTGTNPIIKVFDTESGKEMLQLRMANIKYCGFSSDNKNIIILDGHDAFFYLYSISSRSFVSKIYLGFEPKDLYQVTNENFLIQYDSTVCLYSIKERKKLLDAPADNFYYFNNYLYCFTKNDFLLSKYKLLEGSAQLVSSWKIPIKYIPRMDMDLYVSDRNAFLFTDRQLMTLNFDNGTVSEASKPTYFKYTPYCKYVAYHDSTEICSIRNLDDNSIFKSPFPQLVREIISFDNNRLLMTNDEAIYFYYKDTRETKLLANKNYQDNVCNYTFSPDGTVCTYATTSGFVKNWSLTKSSFDTKLFGDGLSCKRSCYDRTGKYIIYFGSSWGGSSDTYIYSCLKNAIIDTIHKSYTNVGFSVDNSKIFLDSEIYSFPDLEFINKSNKYSSALNVININSNWIAHSTDFGVNLSYGICSIYDLKNHKQVISLPRKFISSFSCNFSSDDRFLVCSDNDSVFLFNVSTGLFEKSICFPTSIASVDISQDGKYIAAGGSDNIVYIVERSGNIKYRLRGHTDRINTVWFSHDGRYLMSGAQDVTIRLWDWTGGKELATLYALNSEDWAIITPDKLFDASEGAMELINYSVGTDVMQLNQIKDRFYEPGLLSKVLGYNDDPIRKIQDTGNIKIFPKVAASINPETGKLAVSLMNQGGGIGKLKILVNGKEIADDSRSPGASSDALKDTAFINLAGHPYLVPGNNTIEVKAMNAEGYLISRGVSMLYSEEVNEDYHPNIYILTCGVSDYSGEKLDLKYASKDAEDMAFAFNIAAGKLFGKQNTFVYSLNTSIKNDSLWPDKKNIISTINKIAVKIKSTDVFVLYLSGHGINYGGQEGDFYYLTADAFSAADEVLKDNELRKQFTLSSHELTQLLQSIAAHKQVLLIDACASGRLVENLMTKRDVSSSGIRALDRMKDRTGVHIITGCAADAVSYEATRYGQGVLTYSLLEGIKGSALREDKYVDVVQLFQKARERVPELAKGIGGIQIPQVISPYGAQSFDIGLMEPSDKILIPLAKEKPIIVRSNFQDADQLEDILQLSEKTDNLMNEISMKGKEANMLFMDIRDFPDSIKLTGLYSQVAGKIIMKLKIKSTVGEKLVQLESANTDDLLHQIYTTVSQTIK